MIKVLNTLKSKAKEIFLLRRHTLR